MASRSDVASGGIVPAASGEAPQLSVIMCTYNRGALLADAMRSVLAQESTTPAFELIVLDNKSTDGTRAIVERFLRSDERVTYAFESQQGLSFARNAAVLHARAPLLAFTDDDVRVEPDWVAAVLRAFREHPDADMVGGRVLPLWPAPPPAWLTTEHWAPLALVDHGEAPIAITPARPICLVGANLALRREAFDMVGGFAAALQRVKDGIGSLEDHDFLLRLLRTGRTGLYDPRIVVHAEIQPNRLQRSYHRRWHTGHGHFHALLRSEHMERSNTGTLFGVPAHLYRQALGDVVGWGRALLRGRPERAFRHEVRIRFFAGFFKARRQEFLGTPRHLRRDEWRQLVRRLFGGASLTEPAGSGIGQERR